MTRTSIPSRCARRSRPHSRQQATPMLKTIRRNVFAAVALATLATAPAVAAPRQINLDVTKATQPIDRFFDLSVGSDYPSTLVRPEAQAQLKTAVDELGFRYIRFHAIFH